MGLSVKILIGNVVLSLLMVGTVVGTAALDDHLTPLPATQLDLNAERVRQLEQELAAREADLVGLKADLAVCQANTEQAKRELQSLALTNEVDRAIKQLEKAHPGSQWYWDNDQHRILPVKPKELKEPK